MLNPLMMTGFSKPDFADNRADRTLARALKSYLDWLHENRVNPVELSIATGYFNPGGFGLLAPELERLQKIRLLLGAEPTAPPVTRWRKPGQPRDEQYEAERVREALRGEAEGLARDRNLLGFAPEVDASLRRLLAFLRSGKIEVRRYEKAFLHGKAFLFADGEGVLSGSSNFTAAGLRTNLELNLGHYQPDVVHKVSGWFEDLWEEAVPYDLAVLYEARFLPYDPYLIYLRVLYELYGAEIEEERSGTGPIHLTTFQNDGIFRVGRILDRFHGVVVADGVGLGKTFLAGEVMRRAREERRQRVLLVSPATLRDGTWRAFLHRFQLYVVNVSYEQLTDDIQLGGSYDYLKSLVDDYALIVIDEAHAFRNPETARAQALRKLLLGDPPKDLVLLTATPVNNSLWDLYYLLTYFVGHDAVFADVGIPSLKARFDAAQAEDPHELRPDMLYDILDQTTVRRTRHFVKKYYPNDSIPGPDGIQIPIAFPKPEVSRVDYDLEDVLPDFFEELSEALAPEGRGPGLTLARYWPSRYREGGRVEARELALVGLIRSGLLKRFESSVHAFAETVGRMAIAHEAFLKGLEQGLIASPQALVEWQEVDSDEAWEEVLREADSEDAAGYDVTRMKRDLQADLELLRRFEKRARRVGRADDPKLMALADALAEIALRAEHDAINEEDAREKRKVLIFTYYGDTVDWIEEFLLDAVEHDSPRLAAFKGRIASVAGSASRGGVTREAAIYGFAPRSTEAPVGRDENRFDVLITTDILAEGMNLQQCRNIINFDLPWNPMRLVQRHGRIDRIGSPHSRVFVRCFFPDRQLDALLDLELRVRHKLAQAAASIGLEVEVIPGAETIDRNFAETREEIEKIRRENPAILETAGEDANAHSGEEYRQELRKGLIERRDEIELLPWGAGSGFTGLAEGHFFCARIG
ncbi:MAG: helicase-related protein, partial [Gemmatimonadota bacterium]